MTRQGSQGNNCPSVTFAVGDLTLPATSRRKHSVAVGRFREAELNRPLTSYEFEGRTVASRPIPAIQLSPDRPLSQTPVLHFECYKAAGGDLTLPARCRRSPICKSGHLYGRSSLQPAESQRQRLWASILESSSGIGTKLVFSKYYFLICSGTSDSQRLIK